MPNTLPQYKINRGYLYSAIGYCPVILQEKYSGYDVGTCAEPLDEKGDCPVHGNAEANAAKPIPRDHAAVLVWFVRDNAWEAQDKKTMESTRHREIVASAQMKELIDNGLIDEHRVITPKGELKMTDFVKQWYPTPDKILYLELKRPGLRVIIW